MGIEDRQEVCANTQRESATGEKEAREASVSWNDVTQKMPEDASVKELLGIFTTKAFWNKENSTWQVSPDEKVFFEAKQWKEIENGSTDKEVSAS